MNEADRKWLEEHGIEPTQFIGDEPVRYSGPLPTDGPLMPFSMLDPKQDRGRRPFDPENDLMNPDGAF